MNLPPDFISVMEYLLVTKSWWDTVDSLAGGTVGKHFKHYPESKGKIRRSLAQIGKFLAETHHPALSTWV